MPSNGEPSRSINIVGSTISGFEIVRQDANGLAFIAQDIRPVATCVSANHARLLGFEAEGHVRHTTRLGLHAQTSMKNGRPLTTRDYLRRMPPPRGSAGLRWSTDRLAVDGTANAMGFVAGGLLMRGLTSKRRLGIVPEFVGFGSCRPRQSGHVGQTSANPQFEAYSVALRSGLDSAVKAIVLS